MLKPTMLYTKALERLSDLKLHRDRLKKRSLKFPQGKIHIIKNHGSNQFYLRTDPKDKSGKYISKSDKQKLKPFLQKRYDEEVSKLVDTEINAIEDFLQKTDSVSKRLQMVYSNETDDIKQFLSPIDISDEDFISQWLSIPYEKKEINPDGPEYFTDKKEQVRSKSEINIANCLNGMNIPYKYECPLVLGNGYRMHPDFTILDVKNRREVYWEHRGMMDDLNYVKHTVERIKMYEKDGIFLGDGLIITEETLDRPLGTKEIRAIIEHFFVKD